MKQPKIAIVVSRFNEKITRGLLNGAIETLSDHEMKPAKIVYVPGAFEIPLVAKTLASSMKYDGIICLGCVIKGDTAHFEYISMGTAIGIQQANLDTGVPITFGVLTAFNRDQAEDRSGTNDENKGKEAAEACIETINTMNSIKGIEVKKFKKKSRKS